MPLGDPPLIQALPDGSAVVFPMLWPAGWGQGYNVPGGWDDTTQFNQALLQYSCVRMPVNSVFNVLSPVILPTGSVLKGPRGARTSGGQPGMAVIRPGPAFAGAAVISFPANSSEQTIAGLVIDGSLMPAGTADGILSSSGGQTARIRDVLVTGAGIKDGLHSVFGTFNPFGQRVRDVVIQGVTANGVHIESVTDNNYTNVQCIGNSGTANWFINGAANSRFTACQADFGAGFGFFLTGSGWGTGSGSGGCVLTGCTTDRNTQDGVLVNATGNGPIVLTGLTVRRDVSGAGAGLGGVRVNAATNPVIITGLSCYPGVNDDGSGTASPANGLFIAGTNALVTVDGALLHAITAAIAGTGTGASYRNVALRTGSTSAPSAITSQADTA